MKGLYLYGIYSVLKTKKSLDVDVAGGIGGGRVFGIPYQDIEAIASEVSLKEFGSREIQRKAIEDLEWIKDKALLHAKVLERAMNSSDGLLIPMKFGAVFKNKRSLIDSLKRDYRRFKPLFERLRGKEERSMKVYLKSQLLENEIKRSSPAIQKKFKVIQYLPAGRQYFAEEEINEMAKREVKESIISYLSLFLERFRQLAEEMKENKILGKELTQRNDPMIFNGAFLITKEKVDKFQEEIQRLRAEYEKIGFTFESSGPWPLYNFV